MGRTWSLALNIGVVRRVESLTGINLAVADANTFSALADDVFKFVDVLCAIVRPQLESAGVSDDSFAEGLAGQALEDASNAMLAALVDFFPPKRSAVVTHAFDKLKAMEDAAISRATAAIDALTPDSVFGTASANSPASSDQTPTDSP